MCGRPLGFKYVPQDTGLGLNAVMCPAFDADTLPLAQMGSASDIQTTSRQPGGMSLLKILTDCFARRFDR